jgi:hypothetical protein
MQGAVREESHVHRILEPSVGCYNGMNCYVLQKRFSDVQLKFQRFRSPSNLEPRLARALRELRGVEEATCLLELASDDPEGIEGQLKHCMVLQKQKIMIQNTTKNRSLLL